MTIDVLFGCEHAALGHACENSEAVELEGHQVDVIDVEGDGQVHVHASLSLPDGWTFADERGCPRLRCTDHSPTEGGPYGR